MRYPFSVPSEVSPGASGPITGGSVAKAPAVPIDVLAGPNEPITRGPATKGPAVPSEVPPVANEPITRGPAAKGPAIPSEVPPVANEPITRGPAAKGPASRAPAAKGPASRGPAGKAPVTVNEPAGKGPIGDGKQGSPWFPSEELKLLNAIDVESPDDFGKIKRNHFPGPTRTVGSYRTKWQKMRKFKEEEINALPSDIGNLLRVLIQKYPPPAK
ncbi:unnamed protein product [Linum trigynum]|uniref:Myb-like domain-containing protein n=1 Tax=Linum trigynum TaxID=586398 RepID=A0AAV2EZ55_9ROSI